MPNEPLSGPERVRAQVSSFEIVHSTAERYQEWVSTVTTPGQDEAKRRRTKAKRSREPVRERKIEKSLQSIDLCFLAGGCDAGYPRMVEALDLLFKPAVRVFCISGLAPMRVGLDRDRVRRSYIVPAFLQLCYEYFGNMGLKRAHGPNGCSFGIGPAQMLTNVLKSN